MLTRPMKKSSESSNSSETSAKNSSRKAKSGCLDGFLARVRSGCILVNTGLLERLANGPKINSHCGNAIKGFHRL